MMKRKEELWSRYKRLMREERYAEAKRVYRKYLKATDPKMHLWRANFTLTRWKAWPRTMTPFLMNFPGFRRFNRRIITEIEEARRRLGGASPSPPKVERIKPPERKVNVLYASSQYEPVTNAGTLWHDTYIVPEIERLGYRDKHLRDPLAQRPIYDMLLESDFTTGCGHGGECYSEDTEILTENGWKHFYELDGEKVATLNPNTKELEYQTPTHYFEYNYNGRMFHQGGQSLDLLVTPNHNLWVAPFNHGFKPYTFLKPIDLRDWEGLRYKRNAIWNGISPQNFSILDTEVDIEDWLRFFGLYIAEGSAFVHQDGNRNHYQITISQEDEENRKQMKPIVKKIAKSFGSKVREDSDGLRFKNKELCYYLKEFGHASSKSVPKNIKNLDSPLLEEFFKGYMMGDGYNHSSKNCLYLNTSSKKLADDLQEIVMKLGLAATITPQKDERYDSNLYYLSIPTKRINKFPNQNQREWINYEGKVYDVEVPNHLLYVRRNGKPCWSGNSVYTGGLQQPLLELGGYVKKYDEEAIQGMGVKYLSCLLGAKLLPQLVEDGAKLAQGYRESYAFSWDPKYGFTKPENDPILRLFFLPYVRSVIGLLNGMSNKEAFELERNQYLVNAERAEDPEVRDLLIREADIMVRFGDPDAKITES